jgi:acetylornithine deacetylase
LFFYVEVKYFGQVDFVDRRKGNKKIYLHPRFLRRGENILVEKEIRTTVLKEIDRSRDKIIEFVERLVRFKSVNQILAMNRKTEEKECQGFVAKKLRELGMEVDVWEPDPNELKKYGEKYSLNHRETYKDRPQVVGTLKGTGGGKSLILEGHVDVVPAEPREQWKHDPWKPEISDGKMFGRGTTDMKGGCGSIMFAIECIQKAGVHLKGDIQVHSTVDEEVANMGSLCVLDRGYRADACVVAEPTYLGVQPKHKGILWLRVNVKGRSGHAQMAVRHWTKGGAVSAIDKAIYLIEGLERLNDEWTGRREKPPRPDKIDPDGLLSVPTINIDVIHGGTEPHIIPEECYFRSDIKYLPHESDRHKLGSIVQREIEDYLESLFKTDPWLRANRPEIIWESDAAGALTPLDHVFVETVVDSVKEVGQPGNLTGLVSCCDMSRYVNIGHIPTVIYGPGHMDQAHTVDEFIELDQIIAATKGLAMTILNWCLTDDSVRKHKV